jgi:hypothetical protein
MQVTGLWNTLNVIEQQQPNAGTVKNSWPQAQPTTEGLPPVELTPPDPGGGRRSPRNRFHGFQQDVGRSPAGREAVLPFWRGAGGDEARSFAMPGSPL